MTSKGTRLAASTIVIIHLSLSLQLAFSVSHVLFLTIYLCLPVLPVTTPVCIIPYSEVRTGRSRARALAETHLDVGDDDDEARERERERESFRRSFVER